MACADYEFYRSSYYGTLIPVSEFPQLIAQAERYLRYYTQGKRIPDNCLHDYQLACCALAEQYQTIRAAQNLADKSLKYGAEISNGEIQSETVGSYSVTRRSRGESAAAAISAAQSAKAGLAQIARQYLSGTGLLYRGRCGTCTHHTL